MLSMTMIKYKNCITYFAMEVKIRKFKPASPQSSKYTYVLKALYKTVSIENHYAFFNENGRFTQLLFTDVL